MDYLGWGEGWIEVGKGGQEVRAFVIVSMIKKRKEKILFLEHFISESPGTLGMDSRACIRIYILSKHPR